MAKPLTEFGKSVYRLLVDKGISNAELASRIGWERGRIYDLLRVDRPHNATIRRVAEALDIKPSELFDMFN